MIREAGIFFLFLFFITGPGEAGEADSDNDGYVSEEYGGDDCDDTDDSVYPGADEICGDGIDQDCDGEDLLCGDQDGDGYVSEKEGGDDCDDGDPLIYPGAPERCEDGVDQDCDGEDVSCEGDGDEDGYVGEKNGGPDCDDSDPSVNPGATETCGNGVDENCDGIDPACGGKLTQCGCSSGRLGYAALDISLGALFFCLMAFWTVRRRSSF